MQSLQEGEREQQNMAMLCDEMCSQHNTYITIRANNFSRGNKQDQNDL